jgi:rhodanese-related sulfurtransferase
MVINQEEDGVLNVNPENLSSFDGLFIDLRESVEVDTSAFAHNAIHIPLAKLRKKLDEFDLNQPIMLICEKGTRAYGAATTFKNCGYKNISYLGGGNNFYKEVNKKFNSYADAKKTSNENTNTLS